jgi:hypothetical protein
MIPPSVGRNNCIAADSLQLIGEPAADFRRDLDVLEEERALKKLPAM